MGFISKSMKDIKNFTLQSQEMIDLFGTTVNGISTQKLKSSVYFTCMRIMQDSISKLPLKLYSENEKGGTKKATDHYLYNLLKLRPHPTMSASTFWKIVEFSRLHYGHSVVYIDYRRDGKVASLYPLDMRRTYLVMDNAGLLDETKSLWCVYRDANNEDIPIKSDNFLHFFGLTADGVTGLSIQDYLATTIENTQFGEGFVNNYFKGGLFSKGLLTYTESYSKEAAEKFKEKINNMDSGVTNAGKVFTLPYGFDFKSLSTSMVDSQFLQLNQYSAGAICSAFGIKPHMVGQLDRATHSNIEHEQRGFYIDTLQSILKMYEDELNYKLLSKKEIETGYFFSFNVDSILRSDIETRYRAYQIGVQGGFLKANEAREKENLPLDDYGDDLMVNSAMIPLKLLNKTVLERILKEITKGGETNEKE